jgi:hypothetical protein
MMLPQAKSHDDSYATRHRRTKIEKMVYWLLRHKQTSHVDLSHSVPSWRLAYGAAVAIMLFASFTLRREPKNVRSVTGTYYIAAVIFLVLLGLFLQFVLPHFKATPLQPRERTRLPQARRKISASS